MAYLSLYDTSLGVFDFDAIKDKGLELREQYVSASPFPHIAIDDFLPTEILDECLREFPTRLANDSQTFDRAQERLKLSFNPDYLSSSKLRAFFYSLNSRPFIKILENVTGIQGLIPDPYYLGGGFHEIKQGGHLSVHADFNHHKLMNLERRINVLIYLNRDWREEFGGQLELWSENMTALERSYVPLFNRCVIFNTTSESYHGNPKAINHPDNIARRSIALYYYTATWTDDKRDHTTQFRVRPGSQDRKDVRIIVRETLRDFLPPIVHRNLLKLGRRLSKSHGQESTQVG